MLEVLRYIALNACVKYCTKDQSNVKGVKGTPYRFQCIKCYVMLCMLKMSKMVFATFTKHCIQSTDLMSKMSKILWIQWPLNPPSVLDLSLTSPTCFKLVEYYGSYEQEWVCMFFSHLGHLQHTIALQPLGVFDLSSTSSTCFNIHSIGWYG